MRVWCRVIKEVFAYNFSGKQIFLTLCEMFQNRNESALKNKLLLLIRSPKSYYFTCCFTVTQP